MRSHQRAVLTREAAPSAVYRSVDEMLEALRPSDPVFCLRPAAVRERVAEISSGLPATTLFAVKCNPHPLVLQQIYEAGIRGFDTASIAEIELIDGLFTDAECFFHHPVKARAAIVSARAGHGVLHFSVDHQDELAKLRELVGGDRSLKVHVRMATPAPEGVHSFSAKFGADPMEAAALLGMVAEAGFEPGLAFHVGSQCLAPEIFADAFALAAEVIAVAGVELRWFNCGGGFPAHYSGVQVAPLADFLATIRRCLGELPLPAGCRILCEPGRAVVADALSLVVQVQLRKDDKLYINEGVYGALKPTCCASPVASTTPRARLRRLGTEPADHKRSFTVFGPTCDSDDVLPRPFLLPADVAEGDWIEIDQVGAYSNAVASRFNGFPEPAWVLIEPSRPRWPGDPVAAP